jgi:hypothetical protein
MPVEFKIMSDEPPASKLKLALVGKEKHGKSWLAATGRPTVLVHDFDNRAEALAGKKGVVVVSYVDPQYPYQPEAAQKFLDILGQLEASLSLRDLVTFMKQRYPKDKIPHPETVPVDLLVRTNVVDSIQTFGKAFQNYALANQRDIRRELVLGSMKVYLPGGWDAWNAEMVPVENSVLRILALPSDTIIILHETAEETADSTSEKPRFTGRTGVFPVRYQRLIKYFNEVWRVKLTQSVAAGKSVFTPKVYPHPNNDFDAATALLLDPVEEPNIASLLAKHEAQLRSKGLLGASPKALPAGAKV